MVITHTQKEATKIFFPRPISKTPLYVLEIGRNNPCPNYTTGPMNRPVYVLHYVVSGSGVYEGVSYKGPCAFIMTPDHIQNFSVDANSDFYEQYWIKFSGPAAKEYLEEVGLPTTPVFFPCPYIHKAVAILREALDLSNYAGKDEGFHMLSVLAELFALHAASLRENGDEAKHLSKYVVQLCDYIHENYANTISESDLASLVHLSVRYMHKIFTAEMGMPPIRYLNNYRMQCAKKLLVESNLTIAKIAESVGFINPNYFCCVFQRHSNGISPSEFRKKRRLKLDPPEKELNGTIIKNINK